MYQLKNNSAEFHFNFHRRFARGKDANELHAVNYFDLLIKNDPNKVAEWEQRPFVYSCSWVKEVTDDAFGLVATKAIFSKPLSKTNQFSEFFNSVLDDNLMPFPFGFINFDLFNTFKHASNVSGSFLLSFDTDHFVLEGNFVTLPPAKLEYFNPCYEIHSNKDLKEVIGKMSEIFRQAEDLK